MNKPFIYWVYDLDAGLFLPGVTIDANGLRFVGGVLVGLGSSIVNGGAFTDVAAGPEARHIVLKKGLAADLPALLEGELGYATDTGKLYVGKGTGAAAAQTSYPFPTNTVTASGLTGNVNDYAPGSALLLRVSTDGVANRTVTGISMGQVGGQTLVVRNVDGVRTVTLTNLDPASADANRFDMGNPAVDATLAPNQNATFIYDAVQAHWVKI